MKKHLLLTAVWAICFCALIQAQSFGGSASLLFHTPKFRPEYYIGSGNSMRQLGKAGTLMPGIRIEANYIVPGYHFPVSGYNGLGATIFMPVLDSAVIDAELKTGSTVNDILTTRKVSGFAIGLRFGYEIPQTFNDFLMLHFGMGLGYSRYKYVNQLPDKSTRFNFDRSDFKDVIFRPYYNGKIYFEPFAGIAYEFERFSVVAQYSLLLPFGTKISAMIHYSHGAVIGIYVPLKRF